MQTILHLKMVNKTMKIQEVNLKSKIETNQQLNPDQSVKSKLKWTIF